MNRQGSGKYVANTNEEGVHDPASPNENQSDTSVVSNIHEERNGD